MTPGQLFAEAESKIINAIGIDAVFKDSSGNTHSFKVLPNKETKRFKRDGYQGSSHTQVYETLLSNIPDDWRKGTLTVFNYEYKVIKRYKDDYEVLGGLEVE